MSTSSSSRRISLAPSIITLLTIFSFSAGAVYFTLKTLLPEEGRQDLAFPKTFQDVKKLYTALARKDSPDDFRTVICYVLTYIFLQSFAIPGSVMLSVLGGMLWGSLRALVLISFCAATGATICYFLSSILGQAFIKRYLSHRMEIWNKQLAEEKKNLFSYIIFLRVTPFFPNWFVNIASPHLEVGVNVFYWGTFFGVAPLSFIHVQAGETLQRLSATDEISFFTIPNVVSMALISIAALIPISIRRKYTKELNKVE
ncbi:hypothetical protein G9A89_007062 [Geosiphon pyriformis]|nr:hypothetical protein G9A89_007062 [Geosiphon pyriformis]